MNVEGNWRRWTRSTVRVDVQSGGGDGSYTRGKPNSHGLNLYSGRLWILGSEIMIINNDRANSGRSKGVSWLLLGRGVWEQAVYV
jgi:hypothetical protein